MTSAIICLQEDMCVVQPWKKAFIVTGDFLCHIHLFTSHLIKTYDKQRFTFFLVRMLLKENPFKWVSVIFIFTDKNRLRHDTYQVMEQPLNRLTVSAYRLQCKTQLGMEGTETMWVKDMSSHPPLAVML